MHEVDSNRMGWWVLALVTSSASLVGACATDPTADPAPATPSDGSTGGSSNPSGGGSGDQGGAGSAGANGGGGTGGSGEPPPFFDPGAGMGISAYHACIIEPNLAVTCFGKKQARTTPPEGLQALDIAAGHLHNCVLTPPGSEEPVVCFGFGELALIPPVSFAATQLSVGQGTSCGVDGRGSLACWFDDKWDAEPPDALQAKYVATSSAFSCAIDLSDRVHCWGPNPPDLPEADMKALHISVAQSEATELPPEERMRHGCAIKLDHSVVCFGDDVEGSVTDVPEGLHATQVSIGNTEGCAVSTDGDLVCWGKTPNSLDGLGRPEEMRARAVRIVHNNGCALLEDEDELLCWGFNDPERYANGTPNGHQVYVPTP